MRWTHLLLTSPLLALASMPAHAEGWAPEGITLTWENDVFVRTDRHYTNGAALTLFGRFPESAAPRLLSSRAEWRLTLGHQIFTPDAIDDTDPIPTDRPYAGWLYLSLTAVRRDAELDRSHLFAVDLGVVGPASGAEDLQRVVHVDLLDSALPRGWRHQVASEPGLILRYELDQRLWRAKGRGLDVDFAGRIGFELGNVRTSGWLGFTCRVGWGVPDVYAPDPAWPLRVYLAASADVRLVGHDLFLDGSLLRSGGVRVDEQLLAVRASLGLTITVHDAVSLSYVHTLLSPEFVGQKAADSFGSISLTVSW